MTAEIYTFRPKVSGNNSVPMDIAIVAIALLCVRDYIHPLDSQIDQVVSRMKRAASALMSIAHLPDDNLAELYEHINDMPKRTREERAALVEAIVGGLDFPVSVS